MCEGDNWYKYYTLNWTVPDGQWSGVAIFGAYEGDDGARTSYAGEWGFDELDDLYEGYVNPFDYPNNETCYCVVRLYTQDEDGHITYGPAVCSPEIYIDSQIVAAPDDSSAGESGDEFCWIHYRLQLWGFWAGG